MSLSGSVLMMRIRTDSCVAFSRPITRLGSQPHIRTTRSGSHPKLIASRPGGYTFSTKGGASLRDPGAPCL